MTKQADRYHRRAGQDRRARFATAEGAGDRRIRRVALDAARRFDWTGRAGWAAALDGATAAYVAYQPDLSVPRGAEDIAAFAAVAAERGVAHVVLLSGRGEDGAVAAEARLRAAPIEHTVLRASWFAQNFTEGAFVDGILAGELALPAGAVAEPFVSVDDVADVAVEALLDPAHRGRTFELTGPRLLTFAEAVGEIAAATGRDIRYRTVAMDDYIAEMRGAGLPGELLWLMQDLFTNTLDGRNASVRRDVENVLGRKPEDFADFARQAAREGAWGRAPALDERV